MRGRRMGAARRSLCVCAVLLGWLALEAEGLALAQQALDESVQGRPRPEYDPHGMRLDQALGALGLGFSERTEDRLGSFTLQPRAELQLVQDDNLFRKSSGKVSDTILVFRPSAAIRSEWVNHELRFNLGAILGRHRSNTRENYLDLSAGLGGRLDIREQETLDLDLSWSRNHEERDSPDDEGQPDPTVFQVTGLQARHVREGGVLFTHTTLNAAYSAYEHAGSVNNADRDRWKLDGRFRLGWEADEGTRLFGEVALERKIYNRTLDRSGRRQGSRGVEALLGLTWDFSGITFLEFGAGILHQTFRESTFPDITGAAFRGKAVWNPTGLTTVTLGVDRTVEETTQANISGKLKTSYTAGLDWEARYNVIVSPSAAYATEDFRGGTRRDERLDLDLRLRWLIHENFYAQAQASRAHKTSNETGTGFLNHRLFLTMGVQL